MLFFSSDIVCQNQKSGLKRFIYTGGFAMVAVHGYYNGTVCIPLENEQLFTNQKVIITALDERIEPKVRRLGTLEDVY